MGAVRNRCEKAEPQSRRGNSAAVPEGPTREYDDQCGLIGAQERSRRSEISAAAAYRSQDSSS